MKWLTVKQAAKRLSLNTDEARDLILQRLPERTARRLADGVTIGERPYASNLLNWADDEGNVFTTLNNGGTLRLGQIVVEAEALVSLAQDFDCEDGDAPAKAAPTEATELRQEGGHQGTGAPAKPKRETQADRVAQWIGKCERRAADAGEPLDRRRMPGKKAEFLDLLHALDAELRSIKTVESLDRYLAGCKWAGGRQPSAAPLFARLFPEARIRVTGAVSVQRRKA